MAGDTGAKYSWIMQKQASRNEINQARLVYELVEAINEKLVKLFESVCDLLRT